MTRLRRLWARVCGDDRGAVGAVEVIVLTPVLVLVFMIVVGAGRMSQAEIQVQGVAAAAARSASLARTAGLGAEQATATVTSSLAGQGFSCRGGPVVAVETGRWGPGGSVTVSVTCRIPLSDLGVPAVPGTLTRTGQASSPIETYRGST